MNKEVDTLLLEVATRAIHARFWLQRRQIEQAKVHARQAAQLLDQAELLLCREMAAKEERQAETA